MAEPLIWNVTPGKRARFDRRDGKTYRIVVMDRVAVLSHTRCAVKRGLNGTCHPWVAHVVFVRPDNTLGRLCNQKAVMEQREGWWAMDADVNAILLTGTHADPYDTSLARAGGVEPIAGHHLCTNCELVLDQMYRFMARKQKHSEVINKAESSLIQAGLHLAFAMAQVRAFEASHLASPQMRRDLIALTEAYHRNDELMDAVIKIANRAGADWIGVPKQTELRLVSGE